jgi:tetratricopeptide (TPR) repeat protein
MTGTKSEMYRIEGLIYECKYEEAEKLLVELEKSEPSKKDKLAISLLRLKSLVNRGAINKGVELADELTSNCIEQGEPLLAVDSINEKIWVNLFQAKLEDIEAEIEKGEKIIEEIDPASYSEEKINERKALMRFGKALLYFSKGMRSQAQDASKEFDALIQTTDNERLKAWAKIIVWITKEAKDWTMEMAEESLELIKKANDKLGIGMCYSNMGFLYSNKGDVDKTLECWKKAKPFYEETANKYQIANITGFIAVLYRNAGEYKKAIKTHKEELATYEEMKVPNFIIDAHIRLAIAYMEMGTYEKAMEHRENQLALCKELGVEPWTGWGLAGIADVHSVKGEFDKAMKYYKEGLAIFEKLENEEGISSIRSSIADVHFDKGEIDKADELYKKSLSFYENKENAWGINWINSRLGMVQASKGEYGKAIEKLEETLSFYKGTKTISEVASLLFELVEVSAEKEDFDLVKKYQTELQELNEKVESKNVSQRAQIAKAIVLNNSADPSDKEKAQKIIKEVDNEGIEVHTLSLAAEKIKE